MKLTIKELQYLIKVVTTDLLHSNEFDRNFFSNLINKLQADRKTIFENTEVELTKQYFFDKGFILFPLGFTKYEVLIQVGSRGVFWIEVGNGKRIILDSVEKLHSFFLLLGHDLSSTEP
jgi:hypothetical protein